MQVQLRRAVKFSAKQGKKMIPYPSGWQIRTTSEQLRQLRDAGVWRNRTIVEDIRDRVDANPDGVYCVTDGVEHAFAKLLVDAEALAASLWDLGLRPGNVISFQLPNWQEVYVINLAAAMLGCVLNPIVPIYRAQEMEPILADATAKVIFAPQTYRSFGHVDMLREMRQRLPDLQHVFSVRGGADSDSYEDLVASGRGRSVPLPKVRPESVKFLMYTSGTTGRAKGVLHSHETMTRALLVAANQLGAGPSTNWLIGVPVTHAAGYTFGIELPFHLGTRTILMEAWDAKKAVQLVDAEKVSIANAPTTFLQDLIDTATLMGSRLPSLNYYSCGGAAVSADLVRRAQAACENACIFRVYGSTEASMVSRGFIRPDQRDLAAETDGQVLDFEIKVVDEDGKPLRRGEEGEILVRGPSMFLGYTRSEDMAGIFDEEGFLRMGDLGRYTADNAIVVTGRKKDLIIRGGENLSAKEIEDVLVRHPAVRDVAAVSMPHARLGEVVCVYVIPAPNQVPQLADLVDFMRREGLALQKCPERLELVDALPRTPLGKVQKEVLRKDIAGKILRGA